MFVKFLEGCDRVVVPWYKRGGTWYIQHCANEVETGTKSRGTGTKLM